jgi:hypothetical protein
MAPRRSERIAIRNFRSVPAFLRLPQEIRDYIYEMLVTTPWTFDYVEGVNAYCMYRPIFDQSPAILLVNKQILAEARRIFYTKNEFIVVRLLGSRAQSMVQYVKTIHVPNFAIRHNQKLVEPVLTVTIRSLSEETVIIRSRFPEEDDVYLEEEEFTLVTTTQAIHSIIERVWSYIMEGEPSFDETLHLSLHFRNKNPSRRSYLEEQILKPWDQIQGFKKVTLTGDFDQGLTRHLEEYMVMGPQPGDIDRYVKFYQSLGDDYQQRKLYRHAGWFYGHLYSYWQYHDYNDTHMRTGRPRNLFKHDFKRNLTAALPIMIKMFLEKMKVSLHLQNYNNSAWDVYDAEQWIKDERYVDDYGLDQQGLWVARAQILLCGCLISIGAHVTDGSLTKDLRAAVRAFMKGNVQSHKGSKDVHDQLCWAIDNFFIDRNSPLRYTQKQWLKSKNHTDKKVSREGWPTLWEWINLPAWPE